MPHVGFKLKRMEDTLKPELFVIDDDPEILRVYTKGLSEHFSVKSFVTAVEALTCLEEGEPCQAALCDLELPEMDGLKFIEKVNEHDWNLPVILVTAHASVESAVEALKKGAYDYVIKPVHIGELAVVTQRAIQHRRLQADHHSLKQQLHENSGKVYSRYSMIGKSQQILKIFDLIDRVAPSNANILITGESGTGKEMVAKSIHEQSHRKERPFIAINCSAIPDQLLESELFGHKKGAFTGANESRRGLFEEAQGGTIFLDEIGDMPLGLQSKLLRVLQERKVKPVGENELKEIDVRLISATHKDLRILSQEGSFREDLYYRICVIPLHLPSLRERREDIPLLANFFLDKYCRRNQTPKKTLSKGAISKLLRLPWPGNVRELENTIERAVVLSDQMWVEEEEIQSEILSPGEASIDSLFSKLLSLRELERAYIEYVLNKTQNSKDKASQILGINRKTLYRKEIEYALNHRP